jgi:hypothetical protein
MLTVKWQIITSTRSCCALIASDLGVKYDEALNVLRDEAAWEYGGMIDDTADFIRRRIYNCSSYNSAALN